MIEYRATVDGLTPNDLHGFLVGWPVRPSPDTHLAALRGVSGDRRRRRTDRGRVRQRHQRRGASAAFIPWLEVLPAHQGGGTPVDLTCNRELAPYYRALGFAELRGMRRAAGHGGAASRHAIG